METRRAAMLTLAALILALAACTTPSGGTPSATARLDTITPTTGGPGTQLVITGRIPAGATLHLCGFALADLILSDPETGATTHFGRATGTVPTLAPDTTCTLTIVRDEQTLPHAGATLTFTTDAGASTLPAAPTNLSATTGNATLAIAFTVPSDGGSPITTLEYSLDGATWNPAAAASSPLQLGGLANEQPITARLRARTANGSGPASDPITATPTLWPFATGADGTVNGIALGVSALADGSAVIAGLFSGTAIFGATRLISAGNRDTFVAKASADGSWAWATRAGGTSHEEGAGVSALADGSAIVAGFFEENVTFGANSLTGAGNQDVFIAKVSMNGAW